MGRLDHKIAIITGGGSGIGRSIATTFAHEGASVIIADIDADRADTVARKIGDAGGVALAIKTDVTKMNEINSMVQETVRKFGRVDILVNNAGIGTETGSVVSPDQRLVENLPEEEWDKVMKINLKSMFLCSKAVIPIMKQQKSGNIIGISSFAAWVGSSSTAGVGVHYNASKLGVVSLTKTLALQLGSYNIRANAIAPGSIMEADPDGTRSAAFKIDGPKEYENKAKKAALGRIGTPRDIATVALFLASEDSGFVTGATLDVNGGRSL